MTQKADSTHGLCLGHDAAYWFATAVRRKDERDQLRKLVDLYKAADDVRAMSGPSTPESDEWFDTEHRKLFVKILAERDRYRAALEDALESEGFGDASKVLRRALNGSSTHGGSDGAD